METFDTNAVLASSTPTGAPPFSFRGSKRSARLTPWALEADQLLLYDDAAPSSVLQGGGAGHPA